MASTVKSVKALADFPGLASIPTTYSIQSSPNIVNDEAVSDATESIPVIDFGRLTSTNLEERSEVIQELGKACEEWGFFVVVNHGVPESTMNGIIEACRAFFEMSEEEKKEFEGKSVEDPIRFGTSTSPGDKVFFWRDYLKILLHPDFHSPHKPACFSDIAAEYGKAARHVAKEIVRGICESLGLDAENYIDRTFNMEKGVQRMVANFYPPCPQPELAMGLPPHSDHPLLTLLIQNGIGGLQVEHQGKWIKINPTPNTFLANIGDFVQILSNGKYKSILHRAVVNNTRTRISIAIPHGPAIDAVISPASELLDPVNNPPIYRPVVYKEYLEINQSNTLDGKSCLERIRIR